MSTSICRGTRVVGRPKFGRVGGSRQPKYSAHNKKLEQTYEWYKKNAAKEPLFPDWRPQISDWTQVSDS